MSLLSDMTLTREKELQKRKVPRLPELRLHISSFDHSLTPPVPKVPL